MRPRVFGLVLGRGDLEADLGRRVFGGVLGGALRLTETGGSNPPVSEFFSFFSGFSYEETRYILM